VARALQPQDHELGSARADLLEPVRELGRDREVEIALEVQDHRPRRAGARVDRDLAQPPLPAQRELHDREPPRAPHEQRQRDRSPHTPRARSSQSVTASVTTSTAASPGVTLRAGSASARSTKPVSTISRRRR
jgi:hypothetical protein